MASAKSLAAGSGVAFALGSVAGVLGNNLADGGWYWAGFAVVTALGAAVSAWLTYRAAEPGVPGVTATHVGSNTVARVTAKGGGPAIGVNYGTATGRGGQTPPRTP